jgi:hypothetical protein
MLAPGHGRFALRNVRTHELLAVEVEGAFDSRSRRKGLLGRDGLPAGTALAIAPCNTIHTFFMRFAIDVVFVSRQGMVRKIRTNVKPWRLSGSLTAFAVIEMTAHALSGKDMAVGDHLTLVPAD